MAPVFCTLTSCISFRRIRHDSSFTAQGLGCRTRVDHNAGGQARTKRMHLRLAVPMVAALESDNGTEAPFNALLFIVTWLEI